MKNKIRILHVAQAAGGVDRYIRMLLKYLDSDKFENILVCSQDFEKKNYEGLVISFEQIYMAREIGVNDIKIIKNVRNLIKKYQPDIVYAHSSKAGAVVRVANVGLKNYCIYNPHGWAFNMRCSQKKQNLYRLIEKLAAPFCDKIVCISEFEEQSAIEKNICKKDKLHLIYNGVDVEEYDNKICNHFERETLHIPSNAIVIGMVGRISEQKAPDVFIKTAKLIKQSVPNTFFIIVGNGDMEEKIYEYARKNGLEESLLITGWVNEPMQYVELFDIAMLLSRWEGFGLVLPEYMMAGKPIIASRVDAIPNIIVDHENGILVNCDDENATFKATMELLENKLLLNKVVQNGITDVHNRFNVRRMAMAHEKLFEQVKLEKNK